MSHNTTLTIPATLGRASAAAIGDFSKKTQGIWMLPGLTGPMVVVASPRIKSMRPKTIWRDILSLFAEVLDLRAWREMDPVACFMLAGFVAAVAQPLVYGNMGHSFAAFMTPVK
jgi:hypothetical protein